MIDEYIAETYPPELFPWLYPELFPEYAEPTAPVLEPEPTPDVPVLELLPEPTLEPVPEVTPEPVQESASPAITLDDLLDIIQSAGQAPAEELPGEEQPMEEPPADPGDVQAVELDPATLVLLDAVKGVKNELIQISDQVAEIQLSADDKPLLTTPFEDYSVSEGLLLLLLLSRFLSACYKILRGGLQWLRS